MKSIWKFKLENSDTQSIEMPKNAKILTIQEQLGDICLWAMVDTEKKTETRHFEIFGTGESIYCDMGIERKYIGTYQLREGRLVFHIFERIN